jgi:hypothetical protein
MSVNPAPLGNREEVGTHFLCISLICRLIGLSITCVVFATRLSTASGTLDNHKRDITKLA